MRAPVPFRHHPRGCSHGRPSGSHKRHGGEDHRFNGSTQPLGSWLDGLPHPEPDPESIWVLKNEAAQPACSNLHLSTEEAFGWAHQAIQDYRRSKFVCLAPGKRNMYPARKLPFMVFDQLDRELFRSVLKGNVHLKWSVHLPDGIYAKTFKADPKKGSRITIVLSELLSEAPRVEILCTLVHQMMHAYFLQCCGYKTHDGGAGGHDLCHGPEFRALLLTIGHRCSLNGRQLTSDLSPLPVPPNFRRRRESPRASCRSCYAFVSPIRGVNSIGDRNWRDMAIAKVRSLEDKPQTLPIKQSEVSRALNIMPPAGNDAPSAMPNFFIPAKPSSPRPSDPYFYFIDLATKTMLPALPRSQYPFPPESYIELHFGPHAYPLSRDDIAPHLPRLEKSPCFTNKRILVLPAWSDWTEFVIFYAFLCKQSSSSPAKSSDRSELPIIGSHDPKFIAVVKSYVSVLHLARVLKFHPLIIYAFNALYSLRYTHENPIAVLESIYHPPESIPQVLELREWTKEWLALPIPYANGWEDYAAKYPTNLSVVKDHPDWKSAYVALREKGTVLVTDLDAVEAKIAKQQASASTHQQNQPRALAHDWRFPVLPPTPKEPNHRPISHQDPNSNWFPFWHDMHTSEYVEQERKKRKEEKCKKILDEVQAWSKSAEEKRIQRQEEEAQKRKEKEERRRKEEERRKDDDDDDDDDAESLLLQLLRDGNFVLRET